MEYFSGLEMRYDYTTISVERIDKEEMEKLRGFLIQKTGQYIDLSECLKFLLILVSKVEESKPEILEKALEEFKRVIGKKIGKRKVE
ncbi:MAG: hypothetical protein DRO00_01195 [Thermoproteota archaeon]|nr:MAG: hypothetical protein DRO00_01195 [Candidatus Korarchaeota archaeon]